MSGWEQILHSESEEEDFVPAKVAKANNGQQILQNGQPLLGKKIKPILIYFCLYVKINSLFLSYLWLILEKHSLYALTYIIENTCDSIGLCPTMLQA